MKHITSSIKVENSTTVTRVLDLYRCLIHVEFTFINSSVRKCERNMYREGAYYLAGRKAAESEGERGTGKIFL